MKNQEIIVDNANEIKNEIQFDVLNTWDEIIHTITIEFKGSSGYIIKDTNAVYDKEIFTALDGPIYINRDDNVDDENENNIYFKFSFFKDEITLCTYKEQYIELLEFLLYCNIDRTAKTVVNNYK